ncbi:MAG: hypothetical protein Q7R85_04270 [bacterium]|nr:hypothetical protein [bacterium]
MDHWKISKDPVVPRICVVLGGAGWGDVSVMQPERSFFLVPTEDYNRRPILMAFSGLKELSDHKRVVEYGHVSGKEVLILKGRVHINEALAHPEYAFYARLQIEMLIKMGCRTFILTSAAASFRENVKLGDIIVASGFSGHSAPNMPLEADEKPEPERVLDPELQHLACEVGKSAGLRIYGGGVVMVRGPLVPTLSHDVNHLCDSGADVTVTSILPEATFVALYPNTRAVGLSSVSIAADGTKYVATPEYTAKRGELLQNMIAGL